MNSLIEICQEDGVRDITPYKARAYFARALSLEREAGHTTPEAERNLELAIAALESKS